MKEADQKWIENALFPSWWMGWEDLSWPGSRLTEKWHRRAAIFKDTGINAAVIFGFHFRWDYLPVIDRVLGCLNEVALICREFGLRVVDHFSISLMTRPRNSEEKRDIMTRNFHHVPSHPDSRELGQFGGVEPKNCRHVGSNTGRSVLYPNYTSEIFCFNNPYYRVVLGGFIKRHVEAIQTDASMADDVHFLPGMESCVRPCFRKKSREETGFDLAGTIGSGFRGKAPDNLNQAWIRFRCCSYDEFYGQVREMPSPEIALCYPATYRDCKRYTGSCREFNAHSWISRQHRDGNTVSEEQYVNRAMEDCRGHCEEPDALRVIFDDDIFYAERTKPSTIGK